MARSLQGLYDTMTTRKIVVNVAVEIELDERTSDREAAAAVKARITAFLYPVGMTVDAARIGSVRPFGCHARRVD